MSVGAAALLQFVGSALHFVGDLFYTVAETCVSFGDPEVSTTCLVVCVGLCGAGRYAAALFCLLTLTLLDLLYKEFGNVRVAGAL